MSAERMGKGRHRYKYKMCVKIFGLHFSATVHWNLIKFRRIIVPNSGSMHLNWGLGSSFSFGVISIFA